MKKLPLFIQKAFGIGYYSTSDIVKLLVHSVLSEIAGGIEPYRICKITYRFRTVNIYSTRPGIVIGRKGEVLNRLTIEVSNRVGHNIKVKVHYYKVW